MTQGNQNGDADARQNIQVVAGFRTRYSLNNPPDKLSKILYDLAKATHSASYRVHDAFPDSNAVRSVIITVTDAEKGDADDIARFLKKFGFLVSKEDPIDPGERWAFDAPKADEQIKKIVELVPNIKPPHHPYTEMVAERASDPGPPPPPAPEEPKPIAVQPFAHLAELDDALLELHEQEIRSLGDEAERKLIQSKQELAAIRTEKARRIAARQQELEAEEKRIKAQKDELAKQLADLMAR